MVEQLTLNQLVRGSSPRGATKFRFLPVQQVGLGAAAPRRRSSVVEHLFCKQAVAGSNPIAGSMLRSARHARRDPSSQRRHPARCRFALGHARTNPAQTHARLITARWCNGSTNDSDSFCLGSSPSRAAIRRAAHARLAHGLRPAYTNSMNPLVEEARRMAPSLSRGMSIVCFLLLRSEMIYMGATTDLEQRLDDHVSGQACGTTACDPPVALLRVEICSTFASARKREAQIKRWSRAKKEALISGSLMRLRKLSRSRE